MGKRWGSNIFSNLRFISLHFWQLFTRQIVTWRFKIWHWQTGSVQAPTYLEDSTVQATAQRRLSPFLLTSLFQEPTPCKLPANCKAPNLQQLCRKFPFDPVQDSLSPTKAESRLLSAESLPHTTPTLTFHLS